MKIHIVLTSRLALTEIHIMQSDNQENKFGKAMRRVGLHSGWMFFVCSPSKFYIVRRLFSSNNANFFVSHAVEILHVCLHKM
jgi:hypothetical protein